MVSLNDLPEKVLVQIFENLPSVPELDYFTRTNHHTHKNLNTHLYKFVLETEFRVTPMYRLLAVWAIEEGRTGTFFQCLDAGLDPSGLAECGQMSLLMLAIRHSQVEIAEALLATGADAAHTDCDGWTALHHLSNVQDDAVMAALSKPLNLAGANPELRDRFGWRAADYLLMWEQERERENRREGLLVPEGIGSPVNTEATTADEMADEIDRFPAGNAVDRFNNDWSQATDIVQSVNQWAGQAAGSAGRDDDDDEPMEDVSDLTDDDCNPVDRFNEQEMDTVDAAGILVGKAPRRVLSGEVDMVGGRGVVPIIDLTGEDSQDAIIDVSTQDHDGTGIKDKHTANKTPESVYGEEVGMAKGSERPPTSSQGAATTYSGAHNSEDMGTEANCKAGEITRSVNSGGVHPDHSERPPTIGHTVADSQGAITTGFGAHNSEYLGTGANRAAEEVPRNVHSDGARSDRSERLPTTHLTAKGSRGATTTGFDTRVTRGMDIDTNHSSGGVIGSVHGGEVGVADSIKGCPIIDLTAEGSNDATTTVFSVVNTEDMGTNGNHTGNGMVAAADIGKNHTYQGVVIPAANPSSR